MRLGLNVLISGAGVAGPALACRLAEHGAAVTVVETAPALRRSGFAVDFRGPTHLAVLERLGILDELRAVRTGGGAMISVDAHDREIWRLPPEFTGGELEVPRRELSRLLVARAGGRAGYRFGDRIVGLDERPGAVEVTFASGGTGTFDLVVGADGVHSGVRRLAFGPEDRHVRHLGHYIAGWDLPNTVGATADARHYAVPGRMASVSGDAERATALCVFAAPQREIDVADVAAQRALIAETYRGLGWHVPRLLAGLADAPEIYFDTISRVRAPRWTTGRVALLGDAAWGVTLGGMGVGTGLVGAHVLAGELVAAAGDLGPALRGYERVMRPYAGRWQRGASPGRFLAPATAHGLWLRDRLFANARFRAAMLGGTTAMATGAGLPEYA